MLVVIADETVFGQADRHLVPSLQFHGHNSSSAVFEVLAPVLVEISHNLAVNLQNSADEQGAISKTIDRVDGESKAVDTGAGSGEDPGLHIVAASQVDELMFVDDQAVSTEWAKAL